MSPVPSRYHMPRYRTKPIRPRKHRPQWRRGIASLHQLLRNPDQLELAFDVALALDGGTGERVLSQMVTTREGRTLIRERPCLLDSLADRKLLQAMDDGSFGRAYLEHIDRHHLEPAKLIEIGRATGGDSAAEDELIAWASQRSSLAHDLWHVLSGYGADQLGEASLLAFSWAQTGGRSNMILTLGAATRVLSHEGPSWIPYIVKCWMRGRSAACLAALPYEELLLLPLSEVRAQVGIEDPDVAHGREIIRGDPI